MTNQELFEIEKRALACPEQAWQNANDASDEEVGPILAFIRQARSDVLSLVDEVRRLQPPDDDRETIQRGDEHYYRAPGVADR